MSTTGGIALTGVIVGWGYSNWSPDMDENDRKLPDTVQKLPVYLTERNPHRDVLAVSNPSVTFSGETDSHIAPGDSGGPALIWTIEGWTLVGVGSSVGDDLTGNTASSPPGS